MTIAGLCGHATQRVADRAPVAQNDPMIHFVGFVLDDVQTTWRKQMSDYADAKLVLFRNSIGSACDTATEAVGPFYCPLDKKVYIDLQTWVQSRHIGRYLGLDGARLLALDAPVDASTLRRRAPLASRAGMKRALARSLPNPIPTHFKETQMNDGTTTKGFGSSSAHGVNYGGSVGNAEKDSALEPSTGLAAVKEKVIEAKEKIVEIKDMVIEAKDNAMDRGNSMLASVKRVIVERPFAAVAIAFGLGYLGMRITRPLRWL